MAQNTIPMEIAIFLHKKKGRKGFQARHKDDESPEVPGTALGRKVLMEGNNIFQY